MALLCLLASANEAALKCVLLLVAACLLTCHCLPHPVSLPCCCNLKLLASLLLLCDGVTRIATWQSVLWLNLGSWCCSTSQTHGAHACILLVLHSNHGQRILLLSQNMHTLVDTWSNAIGETEACLPGLHLFTTSPSEMPDSTDFSIQFPVHKLTVFLQMYFMIQLNELSKINGKKGDAYKREHRAILDLANAVGRMVQGSGQNSLKKSCLQRIQQLHDIGYLAAKRPKGQVRNPSVYTSLSKSACRVQGSGQNSL